MRNEITKSKLDQLRAEFWPTPEEWDELRKSWRYTRDFEDTLHEDVYSLLVAAWNEFGENRRLYKTHFSEALNIPESYVERYLRDAEACHRATTGQPFNNIHGVGYCLAGTVELGVITFAKKALRSLAHLGALARDYEAAKEAYDYRSLIKTNPIFYEIHIMTKSFLSYGKASLVQYKEDLKNLTKEAQKEQQKLALQVARPDFSKYKES